MLRARRTCLSVPGNSERMIAKAEGLAADEVLFDLEDAVPPDEKEAARVRVTTALRERTFAARTLAVRVNAVETAWAHRDLLALAEHAGPRLNCVILPKVQGPDEVAFAAHLLRMAEHEQQRQRPVGLEVVIESALGMRHVEAIAEASDRLEALILGPGDLAASLGMPSLTIGDSDPDYPGDQWHALRLRLLVAARAAGLQAIDGPFVRVRDLDGLARTARHARALGFDGKWVLHPDQIDVVNDVFTPSPEEYERAEAILRAPPGAALLDGEMVDDATRKLAEITALRGRAAQLPSAPQPELPHER